MITVTATDHENGQTATQELKPDSYVLVCGERLVLAHENIHANGTRVLTLKRASRRDPLDVVDEPSEAS